MLEALRTRTAVTLNPSALERIVAEMLCAASQHDGFLEIFTGADRNDGKGYEKGITVACRVNFSVR